MSDHGAGTPTNQVTTSFVHGGTTAAMPPQMRPLLPARGGLETDGLCRKRDTLERVVSPTPGATKNPGGEKTSPGAFESYAPPRTRPHLCHHELENGAVAAPRPSAERVPTLAQPTNG